MIIIFRIQSHRAPNNYLTAEDKMFGGFGKKKERDLDALRRQQVESLKSQVPLSRAVNSVSSEC